MAAISTSDLFKAYLAYFGRPPDVAGVTYYTTANGGLSEEAVVNGFSASAESQAFFGSMPLAQQIDQIYMNLFNRHVEVEGLSYWIARIQGDTIVNGVVVPQLNLAAAALGILRGAQNGDLDTLNAKLAASQAFVAAMDTAAEWTGYAGAEAAADARAFIAGVDAAHVPSAAQVAAAVLTATTPYVAPPPPAATLDVTASTASANEGTTVLFTVTTTNVAPGTTYSYSISGIEAADLDGGSLSGTVTIDSEGKAVVSANLKADALTEGNQVMTFSVDGDTVAVTVVDSSTAPVAPPPPATQSFILTTNLDILPGTVSDDTFYATQSTLQLGDRVNGGSAGVDTLDLSIQGSGMTLAGFATENVERIIVKSLATTQTTLDASDVKPGTGVTFISNETDGASLTIRDIQNINLTNFAIVDTDEDHTFEYDVGNSATNSDVAEIAIQEIRGATITLKNNGNTTPQSFVDTVVLNSAVLADAGVQPSNTFKNEVAELSVGDDLDSLIINGDADLVIAADLDQNVSLVDAEAHTGAIEVNQTNQNIIGLAWELELNLRNSRDGEELVDDAIAEVVVRGSQGDTKIDFGTTNNDKDVTFYGGNDWLQAGTGEASVNAGEGNDTIYTGALNDVVNTGNGNDVVMDAGSRFYNSWDYSAVGNQFDLGAGNDRLTVTPAAVQPSILAESPEYGMSNNTVIAGEGNDTVTIHGSTYGSPYFNDVDLGTGDDLLQIGEACGTEGDNSVIGGAGNDTITVWQDGNQTISSGNDNDVVIVGGKEDDHEDGNHDIDLGSGDDALTVYGGSNIDEITTINAGTGDDSVDVRFDHQLNVDLGAGADILTLRAEDLQSDDVIDAQNEDGLDTLVLTNESGSELTGLVEDSETRQTSGFETFALVDTGIRLDLTDHMFETAEDHSITVDTTGSTPTTPLIPGYYNGMTLEAYYYAGAAYGWLEDTNPDDNVEVQFTLERDWNDPVYFLYTGAPMAQTVDITDITTPDYHFTLIGGSLRDIVIADEDSINGQSVMNFDDAPDDTEAWSSQDTLVVVDGANLRAADLRNVTNLERIELTAALNSKQTWQVELNDRIINQTSGVQELVIHVDPNVAAGSKLYITFSENSVAAADTNVRVERNSNVQVYVNGVLVSEPSYGFDNAKAEWAFNGSHTLYVETELLFTTNSDNLRGGNGDDTFYADTIAQINTSDMADGNYEGGVMQAGSEEGDTDTVQLNFAVANVGATIAEQLEYAGLFDIERLVFETENNVQATGFQSVHDMHWDFADALDEIVTGSGDDELNCMNLDSIDWSLRGGDDFISFDAMVHIEDHRLHQPMPVMGNFYATVDGGSGHDVVVGSQVADSLMLYSVEEVYGDGDGACGEDMCDNDSVTFGENSGATLVDLGDGYDRLWLDDDGTAGVVEVWNTETIYGGDAADEVVAYINGDSACGEDGNMVIWGDGENSNNKYYETVGGNDTISAFGTVGSDISVYGEAGDDVINVDTQIQAGGYGYSTNVYVDGGIGNDTITVGFNSPQLVTVYGGEGDDSINVHASNADAGDAHAYVDGGDGNDTITVFTTWDDATVFGGSGDDLITVNTWGNDDTITLVDGGSGNDTIDVTCNSDGLTYGDGSILGGDGDDVITVRSVNPVNDAPDYTIQGGQGDDTINLQGFAGDLNNNGVEDEGETIDGSDYADGRDTIVFENVTYNAGQQVTNENGLDTINNFNFEGDTANADPLVDNEDLLDFSAFLGHTVQSTDYNGAGGGMNGGLATALAVHYDDWTAGPSTVSMSNTGLPVSTWDNSDADILVIAAESGFELNSSNFSQQDIFGNGAANTIAIDNNGRAVVIVAQDTNGTLGYETFDVYFVQDVDSDAGSAWAVDQVATINSLTEIGWLNATSIGANHFV